MLQIFIDLPQFSYALQIHLITSILIMLPLPIMHWTNKKRKTIFDKNKFPNYNKNKEKIENIINNCVTINYKKSIYYIINNNVIRLLKINKLLNKNDEIKIDIDVKKVKEKDIVFRKDYIKKIFYINYDNYILDTLFTNDFQLYYYNYFDSIVYDIFKLKKKNYTIYHYLIKLDDNC